MPRPNLELYSSNVVSTQSDFMLHDECMYTNSIIIHLLYVPRPSLELYSKMSCSMTNVCTQTAHRHGDWKQEYTCTSVHTQTDRKTGSQTCRLIPQAVCIPMWEVHARACVCVHSVSVYAQCVLQWKSI